jgi:hypothetical protein
LALNVAIQIDSLVTTIAGSLPVTTPEASR